MPSVGLYSRVLSLQCSWEQPHTHRHIHEVSTFNLQLQACFDKQWRERSIYAVTANSLKPTTHCTTKLLQSTRNQSLSKADKQSIDTTPNHTIDWNRCWRPTCGRIDRTQTANGQNSEQIAHAVHHVIGMWMLKNYTKHHHTNTRFYSDCYCIDTWHLVHTDIHLTRETIGAERQDHQRSQGSDLWGNISWKIHGSNHSRKTKKTRQGITIQYQWSYFLDTLMSSNVSIGLVEAANGLEQRHIVAFMTSANRQLAKTSSLLLPDKWLLLSVNFLSDVNCPYSEGIFPDLRQQRDDCVVDTNST